MISNVLVDYIVGKVSGVTLTKGTNLFAENGRGEKNVVIGTTTDNPITSDLTFVRLAMVNVIVQGYGVAEGFDLTNRVCRVLEGMSGTFTFKIRTIANPAYPAQPNAPATIDEIETYIISSVSVRNWATMIKPDGVFSANLEIVFKS